MQLQEQSKSEARIQQYAFTEIRNKHPETYGCMWHCPNGGLRDAVTATFMRGAGVVRGVQDLCFMWAGKVYMIEVKTPTGKCSTDQKLIHAIHKQQGFDTWIFTQAVDIVAFVECVITGGDISMYTAFISPFSNADLVEKYRAEVRAERLRKVGNAA